MITKVNRNNPEVKFLFRTIPEIVFLLSDYVQIDLNAYRRFLIYHLHRFRLIDLRKESSQDVSLEKIYSIIDKLFKFKLKRNFLYGIMDIKQETFLKYFKDYLESENLQNRRSFTLLETHNTLMYWQNNSCCNRTSAFKKHELAEKLTNSDYKKLAEEFSLFLDAKNIKYGNVDKFSPGIVHEFLDHIVADSKQYDKVFNWV